MEKLNNQDRQMILKALNTAIWQETLDLKKIRSYKELDRDKGLEEELKNNIEAYKQARYGMRRFINQSLKACS